MTTQHKYMLQDYDYILIVSSWGSPREYKESCYVMELVVDGKRVVEPLEKDSLDYGTQYNCVHSSTLAIKRILEKIGIENSKIKILIFAQDTILLNTIIENENENKNKNENWNEYKNKEKKRKDLEEVLRVKLHNELYDKNTDVANEFEGSGLKDYFNLVKFVPGVISSARGAELYTWRGERVYDVMLGSIALYTYMELMKFDNARKIAIIVDTTHGINYFVTALKEGVSIAASLYAFFRATNLKDNGLKDLVIYHYNSDPVMKPVMKDEGEYTPSLKLHLLSETPIVKNGNLNPNAIFSHIETQVLIKDVKVFEDLWENIDWRKVIDTLLLFSKGVLSWALRNINDLKDLDSKLNEDTLKNAIEEIKLRFEEKQSIMTTIIRRQITYDLGKNVPSINIVISALLLNALRNLANNTAPENINIKSNIENLAKKLEEKTSTKEIKEISEILKDFLNKDFICLDLDKLMDTVVKRLYLSPHREINENEFKNLKEYLQDKEPHWNCIINEHDLKIYEEPHKAAYLAVYNNVRYIISREEKQIELRNFLAHAGLAYGLQWLSLGTNNKYILCLGDPSKPAELIRQAS